jgi:hypothetical protein
MMTEKKRARLAVIADSIHADEEVQWDLLALWLEPGNEPKPRRAEGHFVLTDRRLIFATPQRGILVDLARVLIKKADLVKIRFTMAHLQIETEDERPLTFVADKRASKLMADAINKARPK